MSAENGTTPKITVIQTNTRCTTVEEFVASFRGLCDETSCFIPTASVRPVGLQTGFSIQLSDGTPMIRGLGVVLDAFPTTDNVFKRAGIRIGVHRLTADSKAIVEKLKLAAPAAPVATPVPAAPVSKPARTAPRVVTIPTSATPTTEARPLAKKLTPPKVPVHASFDDKVDGPTTVEIPGMRSQFREFEDAAHTTVEIPNKAPVAPVPVPVPVAPAAPVVPAKLQPLQIDHDFDEIPDGPTVIDTPDHAKQAPGSSFILPANPLAAISDDSLGAFIDCMVYEDVTADLAPPAEAPAPEAVPPPPAPPREMSTLLGVAPLVAPVQVPIAYVQPPPEPPAPWPTPIPQLALAEAPRASLPHAPVNRLRWVVIGAVAISTILIAVIVKLALRAP